jgi:hypothetical protein
MINTEVETSQKTVIFDPTYQRYTSCCCLPHGSCCPFPNEIHSWHCVRSSRHITARYWPLPFQAPVPYASTLPNCQPDIETLILLCGDFIVDSTQYKILHRFTKGNVNPDCVTQSPIPLSSTYFDVTIARNFSAEFVPYSSYFPYHQKVLKRVYNERYLQHLPRKKRSKDVFASKLAAVSMTAHTKIFMIFGVSALMNVAKRIRNGVQNMLASTGSYEVSNGLHVEHSSTGSDDSQYCGCIEFHYTMFSAKRCVWPCGLTEPSACSLQMHLLYER